MLKIPVIYNINLINLFFNLAINANNKSNEQQNEPVPEPPRELTLEEWKAKQKVEAPKFNVRKPGEGSDKKIYQKLVPIKRSEENNKNNFEQDEEEEVQVVSCFFFN